MTYVSYYPQDDYVIMAGDADGDGGTPLDFLTNIHPMLTPVNILIGIGGLVALAFLIPASAK